MEIFRKFQSKNMPDRIADEKKVVALMIRMYCRRHCRHPGSKSPWNMKCHKR